jgi:copper chaperone CopZ
MRSATLLVITLASLGLAACGATAEEDAQAPAKPEVRFEAVYLEFKGIEPSEAVAVTTAVTRVEGVQSFRWTVPRAEGKVVREVGKAGDDLLSATAMSAGAEAVGALPVTGTRFLFDQKLHCKGCAKSVNKALRAVAGVKESIVAEDMASVTVVYDTRTVRPSDIEAVLSGIERPGRAEV